MISSGFSHFNKIQRLQNRSARIITRNYDYFNTRGIDIELLQEITIILIQEV